MRYISNRRRWQRRGPVHHKGMFRGEAHSDGPSVPESKSDREETLLCMQPEGGNREEAMTTEMEDVEQGE